MGVLFSFGRGSRDPTDPNTTTTIINTLNNPNQTELNTTNNNNSNNIPNSRLNLIYNQITSSAGVAAAATKIRRKKNRSDLFNVSFSAYFFIAGRRFKNLVSQAAQTFLFGDQLDLSFILAHKPVTVRFVYFFK